MEGLIHGGACFRIFTVYDLNCIAMHTEYSVIGNDNHYVEKQRLLCNLLFYFNQLGIESTIVHYSIAKSIA